MSEKKKFRLNYYVEEYVVAVIMTLMLVLCFANVLARYVFSLPMTFTDALLSSIFPWVTFLGAPIACVRKKNTALTLVTDLLPDKYQKHVELVTTIASLFLFVFLLYYGSLKSWNYFKYNNTLYELNDAPKWIFSLCIPLGSIMYIIRTVQVAVIAFKKGGKEETKGGDLL